MEQKGLDKNFFIGIFLIFGLIMAIPLLQSDSSINSVNTPNSVDTSNSIDTLGNSRKNIEVLESKSSNFDKNNGASNLTPSLVDSLSNEYISIRFANNGSIKEVVLKQDAQGKRYQTYDSADLKLINDLDFYISWLNEDSEEIIDTKNKYLKSQKNKTLTSISFTDEDEEIELRYELEPGGYQLNFDIFFNDPTEKENVTVHFNQKIKQLEKSLTNERYYSSIAYSKDNSSSDQIYDGKKKDINNVMWFSHTQQFFSTILSSEQGFEKSKFIVKEPDHNNYVKEFVSVLNIKNSSLNKQDLTFHFVPNKYSLLSDYDKGFESVIYLGHWIFSWVNQWFIIPMFDLLEGWNLSYGLIILIIAVVIKLILFLPTRSSYLSMAKMRVLKPEIDALNDKFKDPMEKQQAQMNLYKKTGVNPLGGCLPMLFQMPILIALFSFFPTAYELRQQSFLWANDLSTYDAVLEFSFFPGYFDHLSLFALLMSISTLIQMVYSNQMSMSSSPQMPQMKYIMYIMPVVFFFVMNNYASGLSYYYLLANLITFAQQMIIRKSINDDKLYAMLQANKKKPIKRSKFQQKLEEIAKKSKTR